MRSTRDALIALNDPLSTWKNIFIAAFITIVLCVATVHLNYFYLDRAVLAGDLSASAFAHIADTLVLFAIIFSVFLLTSRYLFSMTITLVFYCAFMSASFMKISIFEAPLYPEDISLLTDLFLSKGSFYDVLPYAATALITLAIISLAAWKKSEISISSVTTRAAVLLGLLLLYSTTFVLLSSDPKPSKWMKTKYVSVHNWFPLQSATSSGLLFEYLMEIGQLKGLETPPDYQQAAISSIVGRYALDEPIADKKNREPINLIIYFVEAFIDPGIMNIETTIDAIPTFRSLMETSSSGIVMSPVVGGGSANAEFELLTGMSMRLLDPGVIPYKHRLKTTTNSLATELSKHGYKSTAMHVSSLGFYNYREAYRNLGFDEWVSLWKKPGVEMAKSGRMPSDQALVDDIIKRSKQHKPYFIFAFPNSTHHTWNYRGYESSSLDIVGEYPRSQRKTLKTYINALHTADQAIGKLISHFSKVPEKTAILIMGDHLPAMHKLSRKDHIFPPTGLSYVDKVKVLHQLNAVIWTNYKAEKKDFDLSMNFLPSRLLEEIEIKPSGFLALNNRLRKEVGVFSLLVRNSSGDFQSSIPDEYQELGKDYALMQYDWLYGERFQKELMF